jgi:hypothetical protein
VVQRCATSWMSRGSSPGRGREFFFSPRPVRLWGPPTLLSNGGTRGSFPGVKWPEREADHSPPSNTEVKNAWSYTSTPQYASMAWCSVKTESTGTTLLLPLRLCVLLSYTRCSPSLCLRSVLLTRIFAASDIIIIIIIIIIIRIIIDA